MGVDLLSKAIFKSKVVLNRTVEKLKQLFLIKDSCKSIYFLIKNNQKFIFKLIKVILFSITFLIFKWKIK